MMTELEFLSEHGTQLRQTLIMMEAEDGAFQLIAHGDVATGDGRTSPVAVVRSTNTDREYLFVHDDVASKGRAFSWHCATSVDLKRLMHDLGVTRGDDLLASIVKHTGASEHAEP
ncbi:MAG TPA: hypothetical protein VF502_11890 [Stellaceae bacterium]